VVTLLGMVTEDSFVRPLNAELPMELTSSGIIVLLHAIRSVFVVVSIIALQLLRESYSILLLSTAIDAKL